MQDRTKSGSSAYDWPDTSSSKLKAIELADNSVYSGSLVVPMYNLTITECKEAGPICCCCCCAKKLNRSEKKYAVKLGRTALNKRRSVRSLYDAVQELHISRDSHVDSKTPAASAVNVVKRKESGAGANFCMAHQFVNLINEGMSAELALSFVASLARRVLAAGASGDVIVDTNKHRPINDLSRNTV